jgi:hypothetical protein
MGAEHPRAPERRISKLVESHPSQFLMKSQPSISIEASSWGAGPSIQGEIMSQPSDPCWWS